MIDFRVAVQTTILVVDDDTHHLELRTLAMTRSGFSVVTASGPVEAIAIMNEESSRNIDIAVLDYEMPGINGRVLAEYLKARYPELKVVPEVTGDRVQLQQVLMNLMINGIDAMKEVDGARELTLCSRQDGSNPLFISVKDTGVGLPSEPDKVQRVSHYKTARNGMGLAISRSII